MILFYNKKTGKVFATVDGRVHSEQNMKCSISDGTPKKDIGKFIIGWEEKKGKRIDHNMDRFEQLQKFENNDQEETPLKYKIKNNKLTK